MKRLSLKVIILVVLITLIAGAEVTMVSAGQNECVIHSDTMSPAIISNLKAEPGRNIGEVMLSFTAPGNDGNCADKVLNGTYYIQYAKRDDIFWSKDLYFSTFL